MVQLEYTINSGETIKKLTAPSRLNLNQSFFICNYLIVAAQLKLTLENKQTKTLCTVALFYSCYDSSNRRDSDVVKPNIY